MLRPVFPNEALLFSTALSLNDWFMVWRAFCDRQSLLSHKGMGHFAPGACQQSLDRPARYPHAFPRLLLAFPLAVTQMEGFQFVVGKVNDLHLHERGPGRLEDRFIAGPMGTGAVSRFTWTRHG